PYFLSPLIACIYVHYSLCQRKYAVSLTPAHPLVCCANQDSSQGSSRLLPGQLPVSACASSHLPPAERVPLLLLLNAHPSKKQVCLSFHESSLQKRHKMKLPHWACHPGVLGTRLLPLGHHIPQ